MTWKDGRAYISLTYGGQRHRQRVSNPNLYEDLLYIERERAARERRALVADLRIDERMEHLARLTRDVVRLELEALGYHQHKGEWRARRGG